MKKLKVGDGKDGGGEEKPWKKVGGQRWSPWAEMGPGKGQSRGLEERAPFGEVAKGKIRLDWLRNARRPGRPKRYEPRTYIWSKN